MGLCSSTTDMEKPWNMDQVRHRCYRVHHNQLPNRSGGLAIAPTQHLEIWMYVEMYGMFEQNQVSWNIHHIKSDSRGSALVSLVWFLVWRLVRLEEEQTSPSMFQVRSHSSLHSQPRTEQEGSEESDPQQPFQGRRDLARAQMQTCGVSAVPCERGRWWLKTRWMAQSQRWVADLVCLTMNSWEKGSLEDFW